MLARFSKLVCWAGVAFAVAMIASSYSSAAEVEIWSCDFVGFQSDTKVHSDFKVSGNHLLQEVPGPEQPAVSFNILENSETALVAANGGKFDMFEEEPQIMSQVVMIDKNSGDFVFSLASIGKANDRTTGKCRRSFVKAN